MLRSGELPLHRYLDQLEEMFERREPSLLAFVPETGRFDRLRREAAALDRRYPNAAHKPPLFGVPVGVKDIFHTAGFVTRAGSHLPEELLQGAEADVVTALKHAGALILGKTVTTEFAYFAPGPTRNPHHPAHTPGGSSSGSAAAVAAQLCPVALGTQTIGSIARPASFCGVVGCKPGYGRISRHGIIALAPSFDHVGFFAADVAGVELIAGLLCSEWRVDRGVPRRAVLGIPEGPYLARASIDMLNHFRAVARRLQIAGYEVKSVEALTDFEAIYARHFLITNAEAARVHRDWFPRLRNRYHPKTVEKLDLGRTVLDSALNQALCDRADFVRTLTQAMGAHGIDVWISPSAVAAAPAGLAGTGDPVMNLPWSQAGFPVLSLPSGLDGAGLPLGLQLAARHGEDERLLSVARELEPILAGANDVSKQQ